MRRFTLVFAALLAALAIGGCRHSRKNDYTVINNGSPGNSGNPPGQNDPPGNSGGHGRSDTAPGHKDPPGNSDHPDEKDNNKKKD